MTKHKHKPTTLVDRLGALRGLLTISDEDYTAYMRSYDELFVDSPENTRADYEAGVPLRGYPQGSSNELTELYKVIHLLCTLGSVEKMYMPPTIDPERSVLQNQILFEKIVADDMQLHPGDKVLDLGCGCGAIAEHMAELTGATPYGVNLDSSQIEKAWRNPNLPRNNFSVGDFNKALEFDDESFDAVYAIQPMTYVSDHAYTFSEVFRVLKPGAFFALTEHGLGETGEPHHPVPWSEDGSGAYLMRPADSVAALKEAGFTDIRTTDTGDKYLSGYKAAIERAEKGDTPVFGTHILLGKLAPQIIRNAARNIEERRTHPVQIVCHKPR